MYSCLGVTCHLHFWQNDGVFYVLLRFYGVERTPNKSQHTKLTLEKKTLRPLLPGFELATFRSRVRRSTNKLSRLPRKEYKVDNNPNKVTSSEKYDFQTACQEQVAIITPAANPRSLQVFYSALSVCISISIYQSHAQLFSSALYLFTRLDDSVSVASSSYS